VEKIGFIGLGIMGVPMAGHIMGAGYPLCVYNRTNGKADPLAEKGAAVLNTVIREALLQLTRQFRVIHLCGKGNLAETPIPNIPANHYAQFEYVTEGLNDLYAAADIVLSRAGAGTIFELLAMKKPHLLVPLSRTASRGDQILNANSFMKQGFSAVLQEEEMTAARLLTEINGLYQSRHGFVARMAAHDNANGIAAVMEVLTQTIQSPSTPSI